MKEFNDDRVIDSIWEMMVAGKTTRLIKTDLQNKYGREFSKEEVQKLCAKASEQYKNDPKFVGESYYEMLLDLYRQSVDAGNTKAALEILKEANACAEGKDTGINPIYTINVSSNVDPSKI